MAAGRPPPASRSAAVRPFWIVQAAALVAVLLFAFATLRSDLMQAAMACRASDPSAAMPSGAMPSSAAPALSGKGLVVRHGHGHSGPFDGHCPYCDAAAHLPVAAGAARVRAPWTTRWLPTGVSAAVRQRGPPPARPTARGPPPILIA